MPGEPVSVVSKDGFLPDVIVYEMDDHPSITLDDLYLSTLIIAPNGTLWFHD